MRPWVHLPCIVLLACHTATSLPTQVTPPTTPAPHTPPGESPAPTDASVEESPAASGASLSGDRFLVETRAGQLVLRSVGSSAQQVLADAQRSLYDERLELVWFNDGERLWVLDLRSLAAPPVLIAAHVPPHAEFHVVRERLLEPADGCDTVPVLRLNWSSKPTLEAWYATAPPLAPAGAAWLVAQLSRPARTLAEQKTFGSTLAESKGAGAPARCEAPFVCGSSLPFGNGGRQLVLVEAGVGADCWAFGCLLRDDTGALATPPEAKQWTSGAAVPPGSCGPYRFNQQGTAFLVGELLCAIGGSCQALSARTLGWLEPGSSVGAPE
jgi:hypothetical protein